METLGREPAANGFSFGLKNRFRTSPVIVWMNPHVRYDLPLLYEPDQVKVSFWKHRGSTMANDFADAGWVVFVRGEASGPAVYLAGFGTARESEMAVRRRYRTETIKIKQFVRLSKAKVVGFKLRAGELRPWQ